MPRLWDRRGSATVNSWASNSSFMSKNDTSRGRGRAGVGGGGGGSSSVRSARSRSTSVGVRSGISNNSRSASRTRSRHGGGVTNGTNGVGDGGSKKLPPSSKLTSGSSVGSSSRSSRSQKTNPFRKATNSATRSSSTSMANGKSGGVGAGSKFSSENNIDSDNSPPPGAEELSDATSPLSSNTNSTSSPSSHGAQDQQQLSSQPLSQPPQTRPGVNYLVSNQLLSAHKTYIDELMESLRTEMNTIRDFEALLVKAQNNPDEATGVYGPSEDDVLGYYESVYSYLYRGSENSTRLRHELERIGRTEFQA